MTACVVVLSARVTDPSEPAPPAGSDGRPRGGHQVTPVADRRAVLSVALERRARSQVRTSLDVLVRREDR